MNEAFVLILMLFCHIVDDYYLQGILAQMKQKNFWLKNVPEKMYKYDYIVALVMHSFSWSFMIMLPIAMFYSFIPHFIFFVIMPVNTVIHAIVDHLKANARKINLTTDQSIHILQILITFFILIKK